MSGVGCLMKSYKAFPFLTLLACMSLCSCYHQFSTTTGGGANSVTRRDGTARICELNAKPLRAIDDWLRDYAAFWDANLRSLKNYVEGDQ